MPITALSRLLQLVVEEEPAAQAGAPGRLESSAVAQPVAAAAVAGLVVAAAGRIVEEVETADIAAYS